MKTSLIKDKKAFGLEIRELRLRNGWTLKDFSQLVLTTKPHISKVENGHCGISKNTLLLWVKVLDKENEVETFKRLSRM